MRQKLLNIDILSMMEQIVNANTAHYKEDLEADKETILESVAEREKENRTFVWLSRPNGTNITKEREVYLKDSSGYNGIQHYAENYPEGILCYVIEVLKLEGNVVKGNIYTEDLQRLAKEAKMKAIPIDHICYHYERGMRQFKTYSFALIDPEYGAFVKFSNEPTDPDELRAILCEKAEKRIKGTETDSVQFAFNVKYARLRRDAVKIKNEYRRFLKENPSSNEFVMALPDLYADMKEAGNLLLQLGINGVKIRKMDTKDVMYICIPRLIRNSIYPGQLNYVENYG